MTELAEFTLVTFPLSGANSSLTALVESITPKDAPAVTVDATPYGKSEVLEPRRTYGSLPLPPPPWG